MHYGFLTYPWNKEVYGWDLNQIGSTLLVVPDFSHWSVDSINPEIDEDKFAKQIEEKGVKAIIYKGTDSVNGRLFTDLTATFWWNIGAKFGLARGSYHWLKPSVDPKVAFDYHNTYINNYPTELPYILDFEETNIGSATDYLWRASVWLGLAKQELNGDLPVIYSARWYIDGYMKTKIPSYDWEKKIGWLREYPLWVAAYTRYYPTSFWPWTDFVGWQYTDAGDFPYYDDNDQYYGDAWGTPSKGLDLNLFKASWLNKYITETPVEDPQEDPLVTSMRGKLDEINRLSLEIKEELGEYTKK